MTAALLAASLAIPGAPAASAHDEDRVERATDRDSSGSDDRLDRIDDRSGSSNRDLDSNADRDLRRAEEDRIRDEIRAREDAAEDAARAAEDAAEDAAKLAEDAADDAADAAEDAAKAQAEAEEEAAEAAEDAAEEASDMAGASGLRDLAGSERPELDAEGYPVRRGEVVALDLSDRTRQAALAQGFAVLESTSLEEIGSAVTRLAVPGDLSAREGLARLRTIDPGGTFDFSHYYGLHYSAAGNLSAAARRAVAAPAARRRDTDLRVGMIDTAVAAHPALAGVELSTRDFSGGAPTTAHGTAVASLLAGEGAGRIVAAGVFRGQGQRHFTSADAIARGLAWVVAQDVPVINISLSGPRNLILDRLIGRTIAAGHIVVAAAGNGGPAAPPAYPAALPGVVAVTAVDSRNRIYRYANRGPYVRLAALGVGVPAAAGAGALAPHSGTSFAAPRVAARLARCARRVVPSNAGCVAALEREAIDLGAPGRDPIYGAGVIR
ncbi:MAG TPA: S8 family serine peptidase [Allosphingosinicella sp.]